MKVNLGEEHPSVLLVKAVKILQQVESDFEDYIGITEDADEKRLHETYIKHIQDALASIKKVTDD